MTVRSGNVLSFPEDPDAMTLLSNCAEVHILTLDDYNSLMGCEESLAENEIILYSDEKTISNAKSLKLIDTEYSVKTTVKNQFIKGNHLMDDVVPVVYMVVNNTQTFDRINTQQQECYKRNSSDPKIEYAFNVKDRQKDLEKIDKIIEDTLDGCKFSGAYEFKPDAKQEIRAMYGGFMFIGVFLGGLFTMAAILIIYYKQISEGYDDKERFDIMQKVGLSRNEVKKSIRSQILTVFFMPPVTAGIHLAFAFPMISKILKCLYLNNSALYLKCTICCYLVFLAIYAVVYLMTAKTYYKIVKR